MQNVQLAAAALVLCGANVVAQAAEREDAKRVAPDATFASASGMEIRSGKSPLGTVAFGKRPAPRQARETTPPFAAGKGTQTVAFAAEEMPRNGRDQTRPVPEPPTLLMLMAGVGVLAVVISRRH